MLVIVLCFYTAIASTIAATLVRIGLFLAKKNSWLRNWFSIVFMQLMFGVTYMVAINLDAGSDARIDWVIAFFCGAIGGVLSLIIAMPLFKYRN